MIIRKVDQAGLLHCQPSSHSIPAHLRYSLILSSASPTVLFYRREQETMQEGCETNHLVCIFDSKEELPTRGLCDHEVEQGRPERAQMEVSRWGWSKTSPSWASLTKPSRRRREAFRIVDEAPRIRRLVLGRPISGDIWELVQLPC